MADVKILDNIKEDDDMLDEYDFSDAICGNPFKEKMKNGYGVLVHYGPKAEIGTDMYFIDNTIDKISYIIYEKMRDVPSEQLEGKLKQILETVKESVK